MEQNHIRGEVSLREFYIRSILDHIAFFILSGTVAGALSALLTLYFHANEGKDFSAVFTLGWVVIGFFVLMIRILIKPFREIVLNTSTKTITIQNRCGKLTWRKKTHSVEQIDELYTWSGNSAHLWIKYANGKKRELMMYDRGNKRMDEISALAKKWVERLKSGGRGDNNAVDEYTLIKQIGKKYTTFAKRKRKLTLITVCNILVWAITSHIMLVQML